MSTPELTKQIENLTRYLCANPNENMTILSETVLNGVGDIIAKFSNHLQAVVAIRTIREEIAKQQKAVAIEAHMATRHGNVI